MLESAALTGWEKSYILPNHTDYSFHHMDVTN